MICSAAASLEARQLISPVPREITQNGTAFASEGLTYRLTGADYADSLAVATLSRKLTVADGGMVEIVIGEADDAAVASVAGKIPSQAEGYYLSVAPGKVIIAGRDGDGTFYGVQSYLQLASLAEVPAVEVADYPAVGVRGVIEGYYGNPWSFDNRKDMFEFFAANKMNTYVYGPKDDAYHRSNWEQFYPAEEAARMAELIKYARDCNVEFVWAMHPSNAIEGDNLQKAKAKFEDMYRLGVRRFSIFFDDINANSVDAQVAYLNYLDREFVKAHDDIAPLIVCPTEYNKAWSGNTYLKTMGTGLNPDIEIMWTGAGVVDLFWPNENDGPGASKWFRNQTGRKPFIWMNYPTNDYGGHSLMMGPVRGMATDINNYVTALCFNPMEYANGSKVGLYSLADYSWNPIDYDADDAWERSMSYLLPDNADALRTFCLNNIMYYQSSHGLRTTGETPAFKALIDADADITPANAEAYRAFFAGQQNAANELLGLAGQGEPLTSELKEWIEAMLLQGRRGETLVDMALALASSTPEDFIGLYKNYISLTAEADALISRDFPGSIRKMHPITGMEYVEPWIIAGAAEMTDRFKDLGVEYPEGLFPRQIVENGSYYILVNGKYLTNAEGSSKPTLTATPDEFQHNRQIWKIKYVSATGRYSLRSAQDDRYVNELVNFGTNPYDESWNTYDITPLGGYYAIQNGGNGGQHFWTVSASGQPVKGNNTSWDVDNFKFRIVPAGEEITADPAGFKEGDYYILNPEGLALRRVTSDNSLAFAEVPESASARYFKWTFSIDPKSKRIKIWQGGYFLNELGKLVNVTYYPEWNSYKIYTQGDKLAIQNAASAGTNFWTLNEQGGITSSGDITLPDAFGSFTLRPVDTEDGITEISGAGAAADGIIHDLQGRRVAVPSKGIYIINGQKILVK